MKTHQKPGAGLICLALVITIAILVIAGCTESAAEQQGQVPTTSEKQNEKPAAMAIIMTMTRAAPVQSPAALSSPDPVLSTAVITFDPIGDRIAGDKFTITGTTGLPAGTNLFWEVRPDTGIPPSGIDMNSKMCIMANNQVTTGSGTANRVSLEVDTKDLVPGKYVALAVSIKGDPMTVDPSTGTLAGYTYLTLK